MMITQIKIFLNSMLLLIALSLPLTGFAEILILKSGEQVNGEIIQRTDKYIELRIADVNVPYFLEDIVSINGKNIAEYSRPKQSIVNPIKAAEKYRDLSIEYFHKHDYAKAREYAYRAELAGIKFSMPFIKMVNENFDKIKGSPNDRLERFKAALAKEKLSIKDVPRLTNFYYKNPQPDKLISLIRPLLAENQYVPDIASFGPFFHLVAAAARNNHDFVDRLKRLKAEYSDKQKEMIEELIMEIESFRPQLPNSPQGIDYLWAEFFATGQEEPVRLIISVLNNINADSLDSQITQRLAEWSLVSNAQQDGKVHSIIEKELFFATGEFKNRLESLLK